MKNRYKQQGMIKSPMSSLLVAAFLIGCVLSQRSYVVVTSNKIQRSVLDVDQLQQHNKNNQISNYVIDSSNLQQSSIKSIKKILTNVGLKQQNVNSFILEAQQLEQSLGAIKDRIMELSFEELGSALIQKPESVIYIINKENHRRLLAETQEETPSTSSKLFLNMTPAIASGLFVTLFLIVMLIIAVSCLFDIKTNDKFASTNLFVGKES